MATEKTNVSIVENNPANKTFYLSVSTTGSTQKPKGPEISTLRFVRMNISKDELIQFILKGHTLCHNFGHAVGEEFGISQKKKERFTFADMVMIDVDDSAVDMQTLTDSLALTPSIAFTTYSNGVKGYRFRLIYLFSEHLGAEDYARAYTAIVQRNGLTLSDNCMSSHTQCSFTNGSKDVEIITSDEVYSLFDLGIERGVQNVTSELIEKNTHTLSTLRLQNEHTPLPANEIVEALKGQDWKEFVVENRHNYEHVDHSHLTFSDGYAILDDTYIEIYRQSYIDYFEVNGEVKRSERVKKLRKGDKRHNKLWCASVIRRLIKPSISFDELVFNAISDIVYYNDNSDKKFTLPYVCDICARVLRMSDEDINAFPLKKDKRGYRLDPTVYTTKEARQHARRAVRRIITDKEIMKHYNCALSDKENLAVLKENNVKISRKRLAEYKRDHNIKSLTKSDKIESLYRQDLTDNENIELFKENGLVISLSTLRRWRRENGKERGVQNVTSELIEKNTQTLSTLRLQNEHTEQQESQPAEEPREVKAEKTSTIHKVIGQLSQQVKPGYRKRFNNLNDFMKPLSPAIKEIEELGEAEEAFSWFNETVDILQYSSLDDQITIKAYTKLFKNKIEALRAA